MLDDIALMLRLEQTTTEFDCFVLVLDEASNLFDTTGNSKITSLDTTFLQYFILGQR